MPAQQRQSWRKKQRESRCQISYRRKKPAQVYPERASFNNPGGFLLSHAVARAVPSAPRGLTSVFGMGTGVTLSTQPPENCCDFGLRTAECGFQNPKSKLRKNVFGSGDLVAGRASFSSHGPSGSRVCATELKSNSDEGKSVQSVKDSLLLNLRPEIRNS